MWWCWTLGGGNTKREIESRGAINYQRGNGTHFIKERSEPTRLRLNLTQGSDARDRGVQKREKTSWTVSCNTDRAVDTFHPFGAGMASLFIIMNDDIDAIQIRVIALSRDS